MQSNSEICKRLERSTNPRITEVFGDSIAVLALRQPPNLLKHVSRAEFNYDTPSELQ